MQMLEVRPFPLRTNTEVLTWGRSSPCLRTREKKRLVGRKVGGGETVERKAGGLPSAWALWALSKIKFHSEDHGKLLEDFR